MPTRQQRRARERANDKRKRRGLPPLESTPEPPLEPTVKPDQRETPEKPEPPAEWPRCCVMPKSFAPLPDDMTTPAEVRKLLESGKTLAAMLPNTEDVIMLLMWFPGADTSALVRTDLVITDTAFDLEDPREYARMPPRPVAPDLEQLDAMIDKLKSKSMRIGVLTTKLFMGDRMDLVRAMKERAEAEERARFGDDEAEAAEGAAKETPGTDDATGTSAGTDAGVSGDAGSAPADAGASEAVERADAGAEDGTNAD